MDQTLLDRIATLEAENAKLRSAQNSKEDGNAPYDRLLQKYEDLSKSHRRLQENFDKCRAHLKRVTDKAHAAKEVVKQWQEFYDRQAQKLEAKRLREASADVNRLSSPAEGFNDVDRTPRPLPAGNALVTGDDAPTADANDFRLELPGVAPDFEQVKDSSEALQARARQVTSSQTTEDEPDLATSQPARLSSDDEPKFVSARPVKRRRGNSPLRTSPRIKEEPCSPDQPQEINSEDYSSPVLKRRQPLRRETSNLDALDAVVELAGNCRGPRSVSEEANVFPRMPAMASSLSEGHNSDTLRSMVKEEPDISLRSEQAIGVDGHYASHSRGSDLSDRALQPLSGNITRAPRPSIASSAKRKRIQDGSIPKAAVVSEDGDMDSSQVNAIDPRVAPDLAAGRRLDRLLDEPTPVRHQIARRTANDSTRTPVQAGQSSALQPHTSKTSRKSPRKNPVAGRPSVFQTPNMPSKPQQAATTGARRRLAPARSPPPPEPEDEPLRARPVVRLREEDFRVNPEYKGTDFAFADTLRGREQRRCLPGCTKSECCGDAFRKAAEMGVRTSKTDDEVLEAYLGPSYASHMASRRPAERQDILIKARTYAIASEHGKHRQAFKRRTTPPGFWRIDMPSTQEEEQDREQAYELGRQEVYDRWREAIVPGGRWKFRDE